MKTKPTKGLVYLHVPRETIGKIPIGNGITFQASTNFHKEKFYPQYSEIVAVADDIEDIKPGDFVFHNHNAIGEIREVATDIYYQPSELIYGTKDKMFGEYVMVEPYLEHKTRMAGSFSAPEIVEIHDEARDKVIIVIGEETGKIFYCSHLMFYEIVGTDRRLFIAKRKELWCDENLAPIGERTIVEKTIEIIKAGTFEVEKKDEFIKAPVISSNKYSPGTVIHFVKSKAGTIIHAGKEYYVVDNRFIFGYENSPKTTKNNLTAHADNII